MLNVSMSKFENVTSSLDDFKLKHFKLISNFKL